MKKLLLSLSLTLFAVNSFAQTSVITGVSKQDTSLEKTGYIKENVDEDLKIIKKVNDDWNSHIAGVNSKLDETRSQVSTALTKLVEKDEVFKIKETDPQGGTYEDHAKKAVPVCSGSTPRLTYDGTKWKCIAAITCDEINGNQEGWIQKTGDDGSPICLKPKAGWAVNNWGSCNSGKQTRTAVCKLFVKNEKVPGGAIQHDDVCSGPIPLRERDCAEK